MGMDYAGLVVENTDNGLVLSHVECLKADRGATEKVNASVPLKGGTIYLHKPLLRPRNRRSIAEIAQGMIHKVRDQRALHLIGKVRGQDAVKGHRPVSYTHLDVYKRQRFFCPLKEYLPNRNAPDPFRVTLVTPAGNTEL